MNTFIVKTKGYETHKKRNVQVVKSNNMLKVYIECKFVNNQINCRHLVLVY